jgi:lipoyl-dependent peroxiredoxin
VAERRGHAVWHGNLLEGSGTVDAASGAVAGQEIIWTARTEGSDTVTSPEELIAAAHAACFAMALSHALATAGHEPEQVEVDAVCTFAPAASGGFAITNMALDVRASVAGVGQADFDAIVGEAEEGCPVSNALRGNVAIDVRATLA